MLHDTFNVVGMPCATPDLFPDSPTRQMSYHFSQCERKPLQPMARRWDNRFSIESRGRCKSTLKATAAISHPSSMISLGTARPTPQCYPWKSMVIRGIDANPHQGVDAEPTASMFCTKGDGRYDLAEALNYCHPAGSPQLLQFITEHVELFHHPPYGDSETCLTSSTTSALEIVLRMLCDRGDWIFAEQLTYPGFMEAAKPLGIKIQGVQMDDEGLLPNDLELQVRAWKPARGRKPSVLYMIPSGHNPTGATQSIERRKAIYELAKQHDLLIIEDDPYYFLQLGGMSHEAETGTCKTPFEYLSCLPPSFLSLDSDGRVLRLDTTSKILAPGLRCGWLTACSQFITQFLAASDFGPTAPSGPSQLMLFKLLHERWGHEGFVRWLISLSKQYRQRRDIMIEACERHLPSEICSWQVPTVGMFVWIAIDWRKHPAADPLVDLYKPLASCLSVEDQVYLSALRNNVQVSKGSWCSTKKEPLHDVHFRLTFAAAPEDALGQATERFGAALRSEFRLVVKGQQRALRTLETLKN